MLSRMQTRAELYDLIGYAEHEALDSSLAKTVLTDRYADRATVSELVVFRKVPTRGGNKSADLMENNMPTSTMSDLQERKALSEELARYGVRVAQPDDPPLFTTEPTSSMEPFHWKATDLDALLEKIGERLKLEQGGQRRTLRLTNPGLPYGTTPTFWASI